MSPEARERSFDELARGLASGTVTRGKALRLMGAALVGGTLASLGIGEAAADECKRNGKACKKHTQCCSGNCVNGTCAGCPSGRVLLSNGTCAIPCDNPADCPNCGAPLGAICSFANEPGGPFCSGARAGLCGSDGSCPTGQFCSGNRCYVAC